jgi:LytS/YehU family sensor histidine kinase
VFVTHVYETVFLIKERERDLVRVAALDRARAEAELAAFLAQIDPHFLFNSLNTLGHLIDTAPARARRFSDDLADLYRYLLRQRGRALVALDEEVAFMTAYVDLLRIRFGDALECRIRDEGADLRRGRIPPTALQLLIENAVKHNEVGEGHRLRIDVRLGRDAVIVASAFQPRRSVRASAGVGLRNLEERARLTTGRPLRVAQTGGQFVVEVPLAEGA